MCRSDHLKCSNYFYENCFKQKEKNIIQSYLQPKSPAPRVSDTATQDWLPKAKFFTPRYCVRDKIFDLRDTKQVTLIGWPG